MSINDLLDARMSKKTDKTKMKSLAQQSIDGNRSGFSGIFQPIDMSETEKDVIESILREYTFDESTLDQDHKTLLHISSEIKAINHQSALLHGERIKKAQELLKTYKDGAFSAWLIAAYGNRQTPYNFLQYYEFYQQISKPLRPQLEKMPRQAIYTLASREGAFILKEKLVQDYNNETKNELLQMIRELFPLAERDQRKQNLGESAILHLKRVASMLARNKRRLSVKQKEEALELLRTIQKLIK